MSTEFAYDVGRPVRHDTEPTSNDPPPRSGVFGLDRRSFRALMEEIGVEFAGLFVALALDQEIEPFVPELARYLGTRAARRLLGHSVEHEPLRVGGRWEEILEAVLGL